MRDKRFDTLVKLIDNLQSRVYSLEWKAAYNDGDKARENTEKYSKPQYEAFSSLRQELK